jgi:hypothetical protein
MRCAASDARHPMRGMLGLCATEPFISGMQPLKTTIGVRSRPADPSERAWKEKTRQDYLSSNILRKAKQSLVFSCFFRIPTTESAKY